MAEDVKDEASTTKGYTLRRLNKRQKKNHFGEGTGLARVFSEGDTFNITEETGESEAGAEEMCKTAGENQHS